MDTNHVVRTLAVIICIAGVLFVPNGKCALPICEALVSSTIHQ